MFRKKWTFPIPVLALGLALALAGPAAAKEQYSYSVKFVCGYNPSNVGQSVTGKAEGEPSVKSGNYATEINLVWPEIYLGEERAFVFKHLVVLVDQGRPVGREPNVAAPRAYADSVELPSLSATMDDCNRIAELLWGAVPTPYPLTIGYLVLTTTHEIDVTAVYTAQTCSYWSKSPEKLECLDPEGQSTGVSVSIDVEKVTGRLLQLPAGSAGDADLVEPK
jgi:hypothetical protein